jgi:hypothetical protein
MGLFIITAPWARAQNDRPPLDAAMTLADLAKLEEANKRATEARRKEAVSALRQAASSLGASARLYETAIEAAGQTAMADWRKKNADLLRSKTFQEAVQLHLRYLVLSLERGRTDEASRWVDPSLRYARELAGLLTDKNFRAAPGPARDLLFKPQTDGVFTRWLRLGPLLPPGDQWEPVPGNLAGVLEKNVRIPWRAAGDPRLDTAWQLELETGAALADADSSERAAEDFNTRTAPTLLYRRATDRAATGQPNRAAADLLALARQHPGHPDFPTWAATLRKMFENKADSAASTAP